MALETLVNIDQLGGYEVKRIKWDHPKENFIEINDDCNAITFKIQNGPIKEVGVNGCQIDTIIETAKTIIEGLNKNFPCRENSIAITRLEEALLWLHARTLKRVKQGVEGLNKSHVS